MSEQDPLSVQRREDGIAVLTFTNPDKRNPMTATLTARWQQVLAELSADRDLRAVVVTGSGPAFCSGADLGELGSKGETDLAGSRAELSVFYRTWLAIRDLPVPTIAALNGHAIGAGLAVALACDLRYASSAAKLGAPFVQLGIHAGMGTTALLTEAVGTQRARELLFTGRIVSGSEAAEMGMVLEAVDADQVLDTALETAGRIASAAPLAVRLTKSGLVQGTLTVEQALSWEALAQPVTTQTADFREGVRAKQERRKPDFSGS